MECNRDEAIRARDIAEGKFAMQDFLGAKKFMLKAQQLYPPLEGATQMVAVLDVHIAAQVKVGINETDWYGILQVDPASDENIIKKQYRRLALLLHPDKNQAKGAEAAFKLIGEAFGVLSDKSKRYVHDSKRGAEPRVAQFEPSRPANAAYHAQYHAAAAQAPAPAATGAHAPHPSVTFWTACPLCRMQYQYMRTYLGCQLLCQKCNKPFHANDLNAPGATFWTSGPFPTGPVPPAPRRAGAFNFQTWSQNGGVASGSVPANGHSRGPGGAHAAGAGNHPSGSTAGVGASTTAAAAAANLVQEVYQKAQRDRMAAETAELKRKAKEHEKVARQQEKEAAKKARDAAKTEEALRRLKKQRDEKEARKKAGSKTESKTESKRRLKKRKKDDEDDESEEGEEVEDLGRSNSGSQAGRIRKSSRLLKKVTYDVDGEDSDSDFEVIPGTKRSRPTANGGDAGHGSRMEKGKSVVYDEEETLGAGGASGNTAASVRDNKAKDLLAEQLAEKYKKENLGNMVAGAAGRQFTQVPITHFTIGDWRQHAFQAPGDTNSVQHVGISSVNNGRADQKVNVAGEEEIPEGESGEEQIDVPNPDFHDFDADRTELHVKKSQVWAVFDETDGMPRFYCLITKVARAPFYVEGVWLEPIHPQRDTFTWLNDRELSLGTGEFKLGDDVEFDTINMFSHLMGNTKRNPRNQRLFEVYPKRPEVWAIYADYEQETSTNAEGKLKLRYDFVLIRSDFSAMTGEGRVVRLQKLKGYKTLWVPDGEPYSLTVKYNLHTFSHQVPALTVTEKDVQGVPSECLELDPASTPADVIQN